MKIPTLTHRLHEFPSFVASRKFQLGTVNVAGSTIRATEECKGLCHRLFKEIYGFVKWKTQKDIPSK